MRDLSQTQYLARLYEVRTKLKSVKNFTNSKIITSVLWVGDPSPAVTNPTGLHTCPLPMTRSYSLGFLSYPTTRIIQNKIDSKYTRRKDTS